MKTIFSILFVAVSILVKAQESSGGGTFPNYKKLGIVKIEEYYYNIEQTNAKDSVPKRTLFFDNLGQMIKEQFNQNFTNPFYSYHYNNEGFLTDIDTNGMFGYGFSSSLPLPDTIYSLYSIEETWFSIDTITRIKTSVKHSHNDSLYIKKEYLYDSLGQVIKEIISLKKENDPYKVSESVSYEFNDLNLLTKIVWKNEENNQIIAIEEHRYFTTK